MTDKQDNGFDPMEPAIDPDELDLDNIKEPNENKKDLETKIPFTTDEVVESEELLDENDMDYGEDDKEEENKEVEVKERHHRAIIEQEYESDSKKSKDSISIDFPSKFLDEVARLITTLSNFKLDTTEELQKWGQSLQASTELNITDDATEPALGREDSQWGQSINTNGKDLEIKDIKLKKAKNTILSGEKAALAIMTHLGIGGIKQVPLFHSGIWVTIKTPKEADIVELYRQISEDNISLGRSTYGSIFSNTSVAITDTLVNFALDHVQNSTCSLTGEKTLKDIIRIQDIYPLIWGVVCTLFPKGFHYTRPCINNPEKCAYILEKKLDPRKLLWVDRKALNEEQTLFMAKRNPGCRTVSEILHYQESLKSTASTVKELRTKDADPIYITIKSPSVNDHITNGNKWINSIIDMVEEALDEELSEEIKDARLERHAQATIMRQYNHWVESIEIDTNIIEDTVSIDKALDTLSMSTEIRKQYNKHIIDYINTSTISLIGIPAFDCPQCNEDQNPNTDESDPFVNIIPIDVILTFFALSGQLVERIAVR
jgi:hypothetical protein